MFLLAFLWLPVWGEDYFINYIQNHLDHKIQPCDDFFNHVCPAKSKDHFYYRNQRHSLANKIKGYESKEYRDFLKDAGMMSLKDFRMRLEDACYSKHKEAWDLLRNLTGTSERDCRTATDHIEWLFFNLSLPTLENENYRNLDALAKAADFNRYIRDPASNFSGINHRYQRLFDHMRDVLLSLIKVTPWILEKNLVSHFTGMVEYMAMKPYVYNDVHERALNKTMEEYDDCVNKLFLIGQPHRTEMMLCLSAALFSAYNSSDIWKRVEVEQELLVQDGVLTPNAGYTVVQNHLFFLPSFLIDDVETNPYSMVGSLGFIMAHEVAHSLFNDGSTWSVMAPRALLNKLADFVAGLCGEQNEIECWAGNATSMEDAPDWMALRMAKYTSDHLQEPVPKELDLLQDQLFFYSSVITMCDRSGHGLTEYGDIDPHTPGAVRTRAMIMNHPDFARAFKCTPRDRMYLPREKQINLLGSDKP